MYNKYNIDVTSIDKAKFPQGKTCELTYSSTNAPGYTVEDSVTKDYKATVTAQWVQPKSENAKSKHESTADGLATV